MDHIMDLMSTTSAPPTRDWAAALKKVSSSALHRDTRDTLDLLHESDAVAVTHYNEIEGYLVAPEILMGLVAKAERAEQRENELATTLPLLLAAMRTNVRIPSETLDALLPNADMSTAWQDIAKFAARFPVTITHGEDGERVARGHLTSQYGYVDDAGTDDELNLY